MSDEIGHLGQGEAEGGPARAIRVQSWDSLSDEALVEGVNRGEMAAFEALYRRHRDWVYRVGLRFTGDHHEALDVLQETFVYLLGQFPGFELRAKLTTFLYPVIRSRVLGEARRTGVRRDHHERVGRHHQAVSESGPAGVGESGGRRAELEIAMDGLSEQHREVVLMRYVDGFTNTEIGLILQIPPGTVKSRLHHALGALRNDPRARRYFGLEE